MDERGLIEKRKDAAAGDWAVVTPEGVVMRLERQYFIASMALVVYSFVAPRDCSGGAGNHATLVCGCDSCTWFQMSLGERHEKPQSHLYDLDHPTNSVDGTSMKRHSVLFSRRVNSRCALVASSTSPTLLTPQPRGSWPTGVGAFDCF